MIFHLFVLFPLSLGVVVFYFPDINYSISNRSVGIKDTPKERKGKKTPQATEKKKKETNHLRLTAERSRGWINRGLFLVSFYFPWKWPGEKKCKRPPKNHAINRLTPKGRPWRLTDYYIAWEFFGGHHFFYFISRGGSFIFPSKIYPSPLIVD